MLPGQSRSVETAVLQREWPVDGTAGHSSAETLALMWREILLTEPGTHPPFSTCWEWKKAREQKHAEGLRMKGFESI